MFKRVLPKQLFMVLVQFVSYNLILVLHFVDCFRVENIDKA